VIGRWLKRDPYAEPGGINLYCFVNNTALNDLDYIGLRSRGRRGPTRPGSDDREMREGIRELEKGRKTLKEKCKKCCPDEKEDCEKDADEIIDSLIEAWEKNFGEGGAGEVPDNVGGFMCWDWARGFDDAADSAGSSVWDSEIGSTWGPPDPRAPGGDMVHFYITVSISNVTTSEEDCSLSIDDGYFDDGFVHDDDNWPTGGPWNNIGRTPPHEQFTGESGNYNENWTSP